MIDRINKVMMRTRDDKTMQEIADLVDSLDVPPRLSGGPGGWSQGLDWI